MNTTLNFILAAAVTLASAAGIVGGEAAKGELRLAEAATSIGSSSQTFAWLSGAVSPSTTPVVSAQ